MNRRMKIALVASSGGHLSQLRKVASCWAGREVFWVTTSETQRGRLEQEGPVYVVGECNRRHPRRTLRVLVACWHAVRRQRPDVVISTGAAPGCLTCLIGKLYGARIVWLDSIANTERLSMSGRIVRPFADLVLTQWPEVARLYPNVEYAGAVI